MMLDEAHRKGEHTKLVFGCALCATLARPKDPSQAIRLQISNVHAAYEALYGQGLDQHVEAIADEFAKLLALLELDH